MARPDRPASRRAQRDGAPTLRGRARTALLTLGVTLLTSGLAAGCAGLRMESAEPTTPSAGPVEQVRQRSAVAATDLAAQASAVLGSSDAGDAGVRAAVTAVATAERSHVASLGGVWVAFPSAPTGGASSPSASPSPSAPAPTVDALVAALAAQGAAAQQDAATVEDGRLARLLASVGLARELQADQLARVAGLAAPAAPGVVAPDGIPAGLSADALAPAVASEDALGFAWELEAARSSDAARARAAGIAAQHRATAEAWAEAAAVSGTAADPRRAAYQLEAVLTDPASAPEARLAVLAGLEDRLAAVWLDLVATAAPGEREPLVSAARTAVARAIDLAGAAAPALPGIDPVVAVP